VAPQSPSALSRVRHNGSDALSKKVRSGSVTLRRARGPFCSILLRVRLQTGDSNYSGCSRTESRFAVFEACVQVSPEAISELEDQSHPLSAHALAGAAAFRANTHLGRVPVHAASPPESRLHSLSSYGQSNVALWAGHGKERGAERGESGLAATRTARACRKSGAGYTYSGFPRLASSLILPVTLGLSILCVAESG
jgi:hypothetical protein